VSVGCWERALGDAEQWLHVVGRCVVTVLGLLSPIAGMAKAHAHARNGTRGEEEASGEAKGSSTQSSRRANACASPLRSMICTHCEIAGRSRGLARNKRSKGVKIPSARFLGLGVGSSVVEKVESCGVREGWGGYDRG